MKPPRKAFPCYVIVILICTFWEVYRIYPTYVCFMFSMAPNLMIELFVPYPNIIPWPNELTLRLYTQLPICLRWRGLVLCIYGIDFDVFILLTGIEVHVTMHMILLCRCISSWNLVPYIYIYIITYIYQWFSGFVNAFSSACCHVSLHK